MHFRVGRSCRAPLTSALVVVSLSGSFSRAAAALEPAPPEAAPAPAGGRLTLALLGGLSYGNRQGSGDPTLLAGYGGRAGYRFQTTPLYLGVTVFHRQQQLRGDAGEVTDTEHIATVELDLGGEFSVRRVVFRPYAGLGTALVIYDQNSAIVPVFVPGLLVRYPLGIVDLGLDGRWETGYGHGGSLALLASLGLAL